MPIECSAIFYGACCNGRHHNVTAIARIAGHGKVPGLIGGGFLISGLGLRERGAAGCNEKNNWKSNFRHRPSQLIGRSVDWPTVRLLRSGGIDTNKINLVL